MHWPALLPAAALALSLAVEAARAAVPSPPEPAPAETSPTIDWGREKAFWAFQAPRPQPRPLVQDVRWPSQPLDHFILARLEARGLTPSPAADRRTLLRRASFDLTGLPPTPEEMTRFLADEAPDAWARVVERLLASPRFGERLASLWLPLARYAEDQAHQVGDDTTMFYPNAHLYRAWVIGAFNRDLPYDQFLQLQLAADRYPGCADENAALGFLGLGPKYYNRDRLEVQADEWEDRVDTVCRTMLGLTVACARCHDHKFDPIPTRDYYSLAGIFASTRMVNKSPDGRIIEGKVRADRMPAGTLHMVEEGEPRDLNVFIRGRVDRKGPVAQRGFLGILGVPGSEPFKEGSGRRQLAEAIANRANPLTARVMVNRLWGQFFGRPLSPTPSNFGHSGIPPTHPELLDDLAVRFMDRGWSIRSLVREFVLSSTYRQDSQVRPDTTTKDPANDWLSRMSRRRLSIEQWRDTVLFVAGQLAESDGRSRDLGDPANVTRTVYARVSRLQLNELLMQFDYPDANVHAERRSVTTTATQKLFLLNNPLVLRGAEAFAARMNSISARDDADRVRAACQHVYSRLPEADELAAILSFLSEPTTASMPAWEQFAQVLLTSNEMLYVD